MENMEHSSGRMVSDVSSHYKRYLLGAETYVEQLDTTMIESLLNKPFDTTVPSNYIQEMYQVLNLISALELDTGAKIVEVGSGSGWITEILMKLGFSVTCVEPSKAMIQISKDRLQTDSKSKNIDYICSTLEDANLKAYYYDAILFHESLHHILNEKIALQNAFQFLKIGGRIGIDEFAWRPGDSVLENQLKQEMEKHGTLESPFTKDYLTSLLEDVGFSEIVDFHSINGFIPRKLGTSSIEELAEASANITNNIIAIKLEGLAYLSADTQHLKARVKLLNVDFDKDTGIVTVKYNLTNQSDFIYQQRKWRTGSVKVSLTALDPISGQVVEAMYRETLPRELFSGEDCTINSRWFIDQRQLNLKWHVDLVSEDLFWFSQKDFVPLFIGDLV